MNPQSDPIITFDKHARFTVMAANLIRLEYAENGNFLDAPTLAVAERSIKPTQYFVSKTDQSIEIKTEELTLSYTETGKGFTQDNLQIEYRSGGIEGTWAFGLKDEQALPGTLRTLDQMDGEQIVQNDGKNVLTWELAEAKLKYSTPEFIPGYISRSGYTFYDDSATIPLSAVNSKQEPWVAARRDGLTQDAYFASYGHDYYRGLSTVTQFLGKQPIPPRFAFGLWFSRFWEFTDRDLEEIIETHDQFNIPFDVMVIDMDWHKLGWTGYSWDPTFFPAPESTLSYIRDKDIKITMNLHPADGVAKHEDRYPDVCQEMGIDPQSGETVPFDCTDPQFMDAYFRHLHHPFEDQGVRFWWMDWQQGETTAIEGLDPLPWINELHWRDLATRFPQRRPMIFSRFGGPGAGRYPIGFSGDTHITWDTLAFQPYFTATAANVAYGYWSHDIGGHFMTDSTDPELYTRWVQFGAYSPILRLHETKSTEDHRFLWNYKRPYQDVLIATARKRYQLLPYITSELCHCWQTNTSLCMPMYYEYPEAEDAYLAKDQYFFGRHMLVAPVTHAADPETELSQTKIWIPEGEWIDYSQGLKYEGPKWSEASYALDQVPVFVKPGTIWVEQKPTQRTGTGSYNDLEIIVIEGANGQYVWTEDDGESTGYQHGQVARICIQQTQTSQGLCVRIQKMPEGHFEGFLQQRKTQLRIPFTGIPEHIRMNQETIMYHSRGKSKSWKYQGDRMEIIIDLGDLDLSTDNVIEIKKAPLPQSAEIDQFVYRQGRLLQAWKIAQAGAFALNLTPYQRSLPWLAQTGNRISHSPERLLEEMSQFSEKWKTLVVEHSDFCKLLEKRQGKVTSQVLKNQKAVAILKATK
ncbi:glycoside hydrolase family 31 protein [Coraliomargarita algicola]|uniref:Glycoside hydrolase family 31 protein n=1 Tax=Coraliomargarita algicola TaxID=3092156 RepID=A0ABZ0RIS4_9BACT|nr:TIM-barrel domain-containing protein [Coraliomargarita sp. J2-16]WPJ96101.1 glycoside hydrolase family 31 protein [Coraliomargarita sp. J2-16]